MPEGIRIVDRPVSEAAYRAASAAGYSPLQSRVIAGRLTDGDANRVAALVRPRTDALSPPDALPDIEMAADAVARAIVDGLPLLIVSDFDADGASGHGVVRSALQEHFGVPEHRIHSFIGHRLRDGYGVTDALTDRVLREAPSPAVVITVDQGSTDHARIARLREQGICTVVTDHHGVPDEGPPPDAIACVNPAREDSTFGDPYIAGVHVAWLLCCAVRQQLISVGRLPRTAPRLGGLLDLVALGTMADCVDLGRSANNRIVLTRGLELMNRPDARPVWRALYRAARCTGTISASTLGFSFGPIINARGRLDCALGSVDLLMCADAARAYAMAEALVAQNAQRRVVQSEMLQRSIPMAQRQVDDGCAAITIFDPEGHPGVHGICAARLADMYGQPVAYFSPRSDAELISGSLRTVPGVHVRSALRELAASNPGDFVAWGGHAGAGGVTLRKAGLERFRIAWSEIADGSLVGELRGPRVLTDGELPLAPSLAVFEELAALEPFGRQWEVPIFRAAGQVRHMRAVGDGSHLKLSLMIRGAAYDAIWFGAVRDGVVPVSEGDSVVIAYEVDSNTFRDQNSLQLRVRYAARDA